MRHIMIVGATSAVAEHTARLWANDQTTFHLVARQSEKLEEVAIDLKARGAAQAHTYTYDIKDPDLLTKALPSICKDGVDIALFCQGLLGDTDRAETDGGHARDILEVNFLAMVPLLSALAQTIAQQGRRGTIIGVSSVAGDRGRQSNYFYGAAKGAFSLFLQGLRNRYARKGVHVLTVKPGFIATPMTAHIPPNALFVSPLTSPKR